MLKNRKSILDYWSRILRSNGYNLHGMSVSGIGKLVSEYHNEPQEFTKNNAYKYMESKLLLKKERKVKQSKETIDGCVYFVGNREYKWVKIGRSTNVANRLPALQTGSPCILEILGYIATSDSIKEERKIQRMFSRYKMHHEWFVLSEEILQYIDQNSIKP
jgi:hypothetical protein